MAQEGLCGEKCPLGPGTPASAFGSRRCKAAVARGTCRPLRATVDSLGIVPRLQAVIKWLRPAPDPKKSGNRHK